MKAGELRIFGTQVLSSPSCAQHDVDLSQRIVAVAVELCSRSVWAACW